MSRKTALKARTPIRQKNSPQKAQAAGGFWFSFWYNMLMEKEPIDDNLVYMDEYPHLEEKLRLQRLARPAVRAALHDMTRIVIFERPEPPDGAA